MSARYTVRPISDRTWFRPASAQTFSQFSATWSDTIDLLIREVYALQTRSMSSTPRGWDVLVRAARANTHPDRNNGDRSRWDAVEQAADVLRRAGRLS